MKKLFGFLTFICLTFLILSGNALACSSLALSSENLDFGTLSCENGYVVVNPNSPNNLIEYTIQDEVLKGKGEVSGASFQYDKNKGGVQVVQKSTGNDLVRYKCSKTSYGNGILTYQKDKVDFFVQKVVGASTELNWDHLQLCLLSKPKDDFDINFNRDITNTTGRNYIIDTDFNLQTGINTSFQIKKSNKQWSDPVNFGVYFPKDSFSSTTNPTSPFQLEYKIKKITDSSYPNQFSSLGSIYDVVNVQEANRENGKVDIILDYRFDDGSIPQTFRTELRQAANELENILKPNSKSVSGLYQISQNLTAFDMVNSTDFSYVVYRGRNGNPNSANLHKADIPFYTDEYVDNSLTIYMTQCLIRNAPATGYVIPTTKIEDTTATARASFLPEQAINLSQKNPIFGELCLGVSQLNTLSPAQRRNIYLHELMHILGSVNNYGQTTISSGATFPGIRTNQSVKSATDQKWYFTGSLTKTENGNNNLLMQNFGTSPNFTEGKHLDCSFNSDARTVMTPNGNAFSSPVCPNSPTVNISQPIGIIDKKMLVDNGYCVVGLNDTPSCN